MSTGPLPWPVAVTGPLSGPEPLWSVADFRRLWLAGLISQTGDRLHQVALLWWATGQSHSAAIAGTLLMVSTLPTVLLSPVAGWLADRWGRRPVMVLADVLRLMLTATMAVLLWQDRLTLGGALGISLGIAVGAALFNPASMAILPDVVSAELLPRANGWQEVTMQITAVAGPALGGLAVAAAGVPRCIGANALSFGLSAFLLLRLRPGPWAETGGEPFWAGVRQVTVFLKSRADITGLLVSFGLLNFLGVPVLAFLPVLASDVFHVGAWGYGLLEAAPAVGMAAAAFWIGSRGEPGALATVYPRALLVQATAYVVMGLWSSLGGYLTALTVVGIALGLVNVMVISHFQKIVPAEQLGRFMGLLMTIVMAMVPLSFGLSGLVTRWIPPQGVLLAAGIAMGGLALAVAYLPTPPEPNA